jgi:glycine cleavage system H protein
MEFDPRCRYLPSHEWIRVEGDEGVIGISDYAQSDKAASELYAPASGEVIAVNSELEDSPELVNQSPFDQGWMIRIRIMDPDELDDLLDAAAYKSSVEEQADDVD